MNLYSNVHRSVLKFWLLVVAVFFITGAEAARAININALYLSACKRELGVITGVDSYNVQLLKLDGSVIKVPRYEIIYLAYYPTDVLPIRRLKSDNDLKIVTVKTLHDNKIVDMLRGWPIDFSDTKISFLTPTGGEAVIDRDSLWGVKIEKSPLEMDFENTVAGKYEFSHPYAFDYCPLNAEGNVSSKDKALRIYPQQILSDPVIIKKELDRLKKGHEGILEYEREQQFYAVPQLYSNITTLGLWLSSGSRYGSSSSRNNYTPLLTDEFSSGPFGYERLFLTGSAPIPSSIHEEPQTQMLYSFKADYFHAAGFLDPNFILVGTRYKWSMQDIPSPNDDRSSEIGSLQMGFDYGSFALNFIEGVVDTGVRLGNQFAENSGAIPRLGLSYRSHLLGADVQGGSGTYGQFKMSFYRFNCEIFFIKQWQFMYSLIYRSMNFSDPAFFQYTSGSLTNAVYASYAFSYKFSMSVFGSVESYSNQFGPTSTSSSASNLYFKSGVYGALSF